MSIARLRLSDRAPLPGRLFRHFSHSVPKPSAYASRLVDRTLYEFQGPDTFKFLQGSVTNNVAVLETIASSKTYVQGQDTLYSAFLSPQGRVVADAFMHPIPSETDFKVLVEVDNAIAPDFIKLVTRFKLRSKVKISDVSEKWDVYQVWGNGIATIVSADDLFATNSFLLRDPRTPEMGWRLLASKNAGLNIPEKVEQVAQSAYTVHRMLQGVPEGSKEIILNSSLPLESCMDYMHGVDFHKGCYIGQELTARTHFTGLVRKRILPVVLSTQPEGNNEFTVNNNASFSLPASGADVRLIAANVEEKPEKQRPTRMRSAGKFLNGVHNVGLALLRLDQVEKTLHPATSSSVLATESMDGSPLYIRARFPTWWPSTNGTSKGD